MENQTKQGESGGGAGACEHKNFETATEALKSDHRVIEKVLLAMERWAKEPETFSAENWRKAIDFIRNFADRCHHLKEEKVLFPAMEQRGIPLEDGPIGVMLAEHEEGRGYVRDMAAALETAAKDSAGCNALRHAGVAYIRFLRQHIQKEDDVLFEIADGVLSPGEQKELLRDFEEHETKEIGLAVHEWYLKIAHELDRS